MVTLLARFFVSMLPTVDMYNSTSLVTGYGNSFPACQPLHGEGLLGSLRKIDHWGVNAFHWGRRRRSSAMSWCLKKMVSPFASDHPACQHQVGNPLFFPSKFHRCIKGIHLVENGANGDGDKVLGDRPHIAVWEPYLPSWVETKPERKVWIFYLHPILPKSSPIRDANLANIASSRSKLGRQWLSKN